MRGLYRYNLTNIERNHLSGFEYQKRNSNIAINFRKDRKNAIQRTWQYLLGTH